MITMKRIINLTEHDLYKLVKRIIIKEGKPKNITLEELRALAKDNPKLLELIQKYINDVSISDQFYSIMKEIQGIGNEKEKVDEYIASNPDTKYMYDEIKKLSFPSNIYTNNKDKTIVKNKEEESTVVGDGIVFYLDLAQRKQYIVYEENPIAKINQEDKSLVDISFETYDNIYIYYCNKNRFIEEEKPNYYLYNSKYADYLNKNICISQTKSKGGVLVPNVRWP